MKSARSAQSKYLCQLATDWDGTAIPVGAMVEQKVDGWRALYLRDHNDEPGLFTRCGLLIEGVRHIVHRLNAMEEAAGEPMFFDGEFQAGTTLAETKVWCESCWKSGGEAGTFYVFDSMSQADWLGGGTETENIARKMRLTELWHAADRELADRWSWRQGSLGRDDIGPSVRVLPHCHVFEEAGVKSLAISHWEAGLEGIVLKDPLGTYQRDRCSQWLKIGRPFRNTLMRKQAA